MKRLLPLLLTVALLAGCTSAVTPSESSVDTTTATTAATTTATATTEGTTTTTEGTTTEGTTAETTVPSTTTTASTTAAPTTTADWRKNYTSKQIIKDNTFQNGFTIMGRDHSKEVVGTWEYNLTQDGPVWDVNQGGCYRYYNDFETRLCMLRDRLESDKYTLTDGMKTLRFNKKTGILTMGLNTFEHYGGQGHTAAGVTWPGLLLNQEFITAMQYKQLEQSEKAYYSGAADKIVLTLDLRLTKYTHEFFEGVNACQFLMFLCVHNSAGAGDGFVWFGLPFFDSRGYDQNKDGIFLYDEGTSSLIFDIPTVELHNSTRPDGRYDFFNAEFTAPEVSDEWWHLEIDVKPWLELLASQAVEGTKYNVFKQAESVDDLYLTGMNIGFEALGSYDVEFEVANFSLTSYVAKE